MSAFDAIYKQTITLFNRLPSKNGEPTMWIPTIIDGVHLIAGMSSSWNSHGGKTADNVQLHIPFVFHGEDAMIRCRSESGEYVLKKWYQPKEWRRTFETDGGLTFSFGDNSNFDFFIEGAFDEFPSPISDENFERKGFYSYMNTMYDNVFAISSVQKFSLIPHFELTAR